VMVPASIDVQPEDQNDIELVDYPNDESLETSNTQQLNKPQVSRNRVGNRHPPSHPPQGYIFRFVLHQTDPCLI